MPLAQTMTASEYLALDESLQLRKTELVSGELIVHEPDRLHQAVKKDLLYALESWAREVPGRGLVSLPLDVRIDECSVFAPDLLWYPEHERVGDSRPYPVPALAVEVRSPSTWRYDIGAKKAGYERAGLRELWLVDTAASEILVFRRSRPRAPTFDVALELDTDATLSSPLLAGFERPLAGIFPPG